MSHLGTTGGNTGYGGMKKGGSGVIVISFPAKEDDADTGHRYPDLWNQLVGKNCYITREAEDLWGEQPSIYWFLDGYHEQAARWCCVWTGNENSSVDEWFFPWVRNVWSENKGGEWEKLLYVCKTCTLGYGQTLELAYLQRKRIPFWSARFKLFTRHDLNQKENQWLHKQQIWKKTRKTAKGDTCVCLHPRHAVDHRECCDELLWRIANEELDTYRRVAEIACSHISGKEVRMDAILMAIDPILREASEARARHGFEPLQLRRPAIIQLAALAKQGWM